MKQRHWFYRFILGIARFLVLILYPIRVKGLENIPGDGSVILCANHIHNFDPILLASAAKKRDVCFMAKAELYKVKWLRWFFAWLGVIPVRRGESDMGALRTSMAVLKEGRALGIFAQGHRDATGELAMESGVTLMALRTGAPVVPVFMVGPYRLFRRFAIRIGAPVDLSMYQGKYDSELLKSATATIEAAVKGLKPQS